MLTYEWLGLVDTSNEKEEDTLERVKLQVIDTQTIQEAFTLLFGRVPGSYELEVFKNFVLEQNKKIRTVVLYEIDKDFKKFCKKYNLSAGKREINIINGKILFSHDYRIRPMPLS